MRLKSLKALNLTMVGKHYWKLISNSNAIITGLRKTKYFSLGDYFSACLGHNSSYVWRGLMSAKDVLQRGFIGV